MLKSGSSITAGGIRHYDNGRFEEANGAMRNNRWLDPKVAQAFADQRYAKPYKEMLAVISSFIDPVPGSRWLDLGCGSGRVTETVWNKSMGKADIVGLDCSSEAGRIYLDYSHGFQPTPISGDIAFVEGSVSEPLTFESNSFNGVTASLVLSYAEHWDEQNQCWTNKNFVRALHEVYRVLKPGGQFVWSNNVPDPNFALIFWASWRELLSPMIGRYLRNSVTMLSFSKWLKSCAREGRFHYLPIEEIKGIMLEIGFTDIEYKLTYAGQAWVISCRK